eukprot:gene391-622_t
MQNICLVTSAVVANSISVNKFIDSNPMPGECVELKNTILYNWKQTQKDDEFEVGAIMPELFKKCVDENGQGPFHWAVQRGREEILFGLITYANEHNVGSVANIQDKDQKTALHHAFSMPTEDEVTYLKSKEQLLKDYIVKDNKRIVITEYPIAKSKLQTGFENPVVDTIYDIKTNFSKGQLEKLVHEKEQYLTLDEQILEFDDQVDRVLNKMSQAERNKLLDENCELDVILGLRLDILKMMIREDDNKQLVYDREQAHAALVKQQKRLKAIQDELGMNGEDAESCHKKLLDLAEHPEKEAQMSDEEKDLLEKMMRYSQIEQDVKDAEGKYSKARQEVTNHDKTKRRVTDPFKFDWSLLDKE